MWILRSDFTEVTSAGGVPSASVAATLAKTGTYYVAFKNKSGTAEQFDVSLSCEGEDGGAADAGTPDSATADSAAPPPVTLSYCDFSDVSSLAMNGNASQNGSSLRLLPNVQSQAGSVYASSPVALSANTSFHTFFQFQLAIGSPADGMSFILQNSGASALGGVGGLLGYSGIPASVEVEFDGYQNAWDPNGNHVGVMLNGDNTKHVAYGTPAFSLAGGLVSAWIDYDGPSQTLSVYADVTNTKPATPLVTTTVNLASVLGSSAYVGFTAGSGSGASDDQVVDWQFTTGTLESGLPCTPQGNDPFNPSSCQGAPLSPSNAAGFFTPGGTTANLGNVTLVGYTRTCNSVSGCTDWAPSTGGPSFQEGWQVTPWTGTVSLSIATPAPQNPAILEPSRCRPRTSSRTESAARTGRDR